MALLLYLDSSAFLRRAFGHAGTAVVDTAVADYRARGGAVVSSRVLWLEARRVAIRETLLGNDVAEPVERQLDTVEKLPMTEDVWQRAAAIEQHIKTLDALHLATCELIGAELLTFDATMRAVALARGVPLVA
ncbi:MAG: PIN domain-containing protein [Actinomycetia bacterium]|nr:PIN domain-containing protein [Actinomycetes bacterium]